VHGYRLPLARGEAGAVVMMMMMMRRRVMVVVMMMMRRRRLRVRVVMSDPLMCFIPRPP
jgi:hypothetical protein